MVQHIIITYLICCIVEHVTLKYSFMLSNLISFTLLLPFMYLDVVGTIAIIVRIIIMIMFVIINLSDD